MERRVFFLRCRLSPPQPGSVLSAQLGGHAAAGEAFFYSPSHKFQVRIWDQERTPKLCDWYSRCETGWMNFFRFFKGRFKALLYIQCESSAIHTKLEPVIWTISPYLPQSPPSFSWVSRTVMWKDRCSPNGRRFESSRLIYKKLFAYRRGWKVPSPRVSRCYMRLEMHRKQTIGHTDDLYTYINMLLWLTHTDILPQVSWLKMPNPSIPPLIWFTELIRVDQPAWHIAANCVFPPPSLLPR